MPNEPDVRSSRTRNLSILATVLIAVGAFVIGYSFRNAVVPTGSAGNSASAPFEWPTPPPTFTPFSKASTAPEPTATPLPAPSWSELGYLTSARFSVSTIVTEERQQLLGKDRLILMVVGDVLMGIDLTQIGPEDVKIEGYAISIALPHASITGIELQLDKSQIYDSSSAWVWSEYSGLEKNALGKAQQQLYDHSANNQNMVQTTELLAKLQLSEFLQKTGFKSVEITFKEQGTRWDD